MTTMINSSLLSDPKRDDYAYVYSYIKKTADHWTDGSSDIPMKIAFKAQEFRSVAPYNSEDHGAWIDMTEKALKVNLDDYVVREPVRDKFLLVTVGIRN